MESGILVTPHQLAELQKTTPLVIIDTRDAEAYAAGHIPGAVNLRDIFTYLATSTPKGLEEMTAKFAAEFGRIGLSGKETAAL